MRVVWAHSWKTLEQYLCPVSDPSVLLITWLAFLNTHIKKKKNPPCPWLWLVLALWINILSGFRTCPLTPVWLNLDGTQWGWLWGPHRVPPWDGRPLWSENESPDRGQTIYFRLQGVWPLASPLTLHVAVPSNFFFLMGIMATPSPWYCMYWSNAIKYESFKSNVESTVHTQWLFVEYLCQRHSPGSAPPCS